jgi:hypothetical protein
MKDSGHKNIDYRLRLSSEYIFYLANILKNNFRNCVVRKLYLKTDILKLYI